MIFILQIRKLRQWLSNLPKVTLLESGGIRIQTQVVSLQPPSHVKNTHENLGTLSLINKMTETT